jgi:hypothetical protein
VALSISPSRWADLGRYRLPTVARRRIQAGDLHLEPPRGRISAAAFSSPAGCLLHPLCGGAEANLAIFPAGCLLLSLLLDPGGGDDEGRRGWRPPRSRAVALLGSTPLPRPPLSLPLCVPVSPSGGRWCWWVGVGDRGGGICGGSWSGGVGSEPPLMPPPPPPLRLFFFVCRH